MSLKHTILVVDDDPEIRESLREVLLSAGHDVSTAANGKDALDHLHTRRPDVILLDLMMPVMNGWQFRDAQKRSRALADIPVIVISTAAAENRALLNDVAASLPKPFSVDMLLDTVGHVVAVA
jgi:CheY-like chemotaxis protein